MSTPSKIFLLTLTLLTACKGVQYRHEGDDAGECSDGADNDGNGYFDCQDNACWFSPTCGGPPGGVDTGDTDDTEDTTDTDDTDTNGECVGGLCPLTSVALTYDVDWTVWELLQAMEWYSCSSHYVGDGTVVEVTEDRITLQGAWRLDSHDCTGDMEGFVTGAIWTDPSGQAYHSFEFTDETTSLDAWFAHKNPAGHSTTANNVFYVTEMYVAFDATAATPTAQWTYFESRGDIWMDISHDLQITFAK